MNLSVHEWEDRAVIHWCHPAVSNKIVVASNVSMERLSSSLHVSMLYENMDFHRRHRKLKLM